MEEGVDAGVRRRLPAARRSTGTRCCRAAGAGPLPRRDVLTRPAGPSPRACARYNRRRQRQTPMTTTSSVEPGAPSFDDPLGMLRACHGRIERQLVTLGRLVRHLPEHGAGCRRARRGARAILRYFDTAAPNHHADEEASVFPRLLARAPDARDADRASRARPSRDVRAAVAQAAAAAGGHRRRTARQSAARAGAAPRKSPTPSTSPSRTTSCCRCARTCCRRRSSTRSAPRWPHDAARAGGRRAHRSAPSRRTDAPARSRPARSAGQITLEYRAAAPRLAQVPVEHHRDACARAGARAASRGSRRA